MLAKKESLNVGEDSTVGNGGLSDDLVELLVVADGKLDVAGQNSHLLGFHAGVAGKLNDLTTEVLEDSSGEDTSALADSIGVTSLLVHAVDAADWERDISSLGSGD